VATDADLEAIEAFAERKATLALILAICGFVLLPVIASVFALVVAHQAHRMFRSHPELGGDRHVIVAMVLGWAGLAFGVAALIYAIA
jgi:hypothetical protein